MKQITYRHTILLSAVLILASLFIPVVWLEIGPVGYRNYGPTVPHVYIFGGFITGKDVSFWGIAFAFTAQLAAILIFSFMSFAARSSRLWNNVFSLLFVQTIMLLLFPFWLNNYVDGVICNSDGADLTVHYQFGMVIYGILALLNIISLIQIVWIKF